MLKPRLILSPKLKKFHPLQRNPYLKTWRECMTQKKNISSSDLSLKGLCPWFPKLVPKPKTEKERASPVVPQLKNYIKHIIKTKPTTKSDPPVKPKGNIYSKLKFECEECHEDFRDKTASNTHLYSHNRLYLENTEHFDMNSSQNMIEIYNNDEAGNYIEDIDEAINNSLEEIKICYQFRKVKTFNYKTTA